MVYFKHLVNYKIKKNVFTSKLSILKTICNRNALSFARGECNTKSIVGNFVTWYFLGRAQKLNLSD